ncbi:hypothetical protein PGIGA_G00016600 [Pangasianodon gigas]|uniref:Uncharacterized protein n=1 Tax=Pangasianodon gigas TaxID=30993 RepID=A0ACC5WU45_PANGG|nr:hypothetical protein [Pangasianodon gigas]
MFLTVKAVKKQAACSCTLLETQCLTCWLAAFSHMIVSTALSSSSEQLQIPLREDLLHLSLLHVQALKAKHKDERGIKTNVTVLGSYVPLYSSKTTYPKTLLPPDKPFRAASAYLISPEILYLPQITLNI